MTHDSVREKCTTVHCLGSREGWTGKATEMFCILAWVG